MALVLLHIGYPKTGTTSLQSFFSNNAEKLKARSWLYPSTGRLHGAHYELSFALDVGNYGDNTPKFPAVLRKALDEEIAASGCGNVLLSAESFITARKFEPVKEFFSGHELKLLVYLRRHDHALESGYSQAVRSTNNPPWGPSIDSFVLYQMGISTIPWDYLRHLKRLAECVGQENIIVRPFEREQNLPDLYADFLSAIGIDDDPSLVRPERERNASVSYEMLSIIDGVQRSSAKAETKRSLLGPLMKLSNRAGNEKTFPLLSPHQRNSILTKYRRSYSQIAKEFMGRTDGVIFKEPEPSPDEPWEAPRAATFQDAIDTLAKAMAIAKRNEEATEH